LPNEEGGGSTEHDHRHDAPIGAHLGEEPERLAETEACGAAPLAHVSGASGVGEANQQNRERQIDQHVGEKPPRRPEQ
jgi:hypothetical protein